MSHMYDDPAEAAPTRAYQPGYAQTAEPPYAARRRMPYPRFGAYGTSRWGARPHWPSETKPFFLTSEFWALVAGVFALGITAGASESVDARMFWILTTAMGCAYMIARGLAKAGTRSRADDPRERFEWPGHDSGRQSHHRPDAHR